MLLFLSLSFGELFIIFAVVLLFFGSKSIPKIARTLGRGIRQMKDATQDIQNDIRQSSSEITKEANEIEKDVRKTLDQ